LPPNALAIIVLTTATVSTKQNNNERNKMAIVQAGCNYINKMLKVLGPEAAVTSATMAAVLTALRDLELALPSESTIC
jgi:hypothetical protein